MKCSFCEREDSECKIRKINDYYYCPKHLTRHYRNQDMEQKSIYDSNDYVLYEDHAEIILRDSKGKENGRAIIDLEDVDKCKDYKWHIRRNKGNTSYVIASLPNNVKIHLHRFLIGYNGSLDVDHINRNGLDNRKTNLRIVDHKTNSANNGKPGVKKVPSGRFQASCCRDYKTIYIGTYDTYDEAVKARAEFIANL